VCKWHDKREEEKQNEGEIAVVVAVRKKRHNNYWGWRFMRGLTDQCTVPGLYG